MENPKQTRMAMQIKGVGNTIVREGSRGSGLQPAVARVSNVLERHPVLQDRIISLSWGRLAKSDYFIVDENGTKWLWCDSIIEAYTEDDFRIDEDKRGYMFDLWLSGGGAGLTKYPRPDLLALSPPDFTVVLIAEVLRPIKTKALEYYYSTFPGDDYLSKTATGAAKTVSKDDIMRAVELDRATARQAGAIILVGEIRKFIEKQYRPYTKTREFALLELESKTTFNLLSDSEIAERLNSNPRSIQTMRTRLKKHLREKFEWALDPNFDWEKLMFIPPTDPDDLEEDEQTLTRSN